MKTLFQANRWRLTDDGIQWILGVRKGNERKKASGYRATAFCLQRTSLFRVLRQFIGYIPPDAERIIEILPDRHPGPQR